jgi:hypothetical protein
LTRVTGYGRVKCPQCDQIYLTTLYSSVNYLDHQIWSDGYAHYRMGDNTKNILMCSCGTLLMRSQMGLCADALHVKHTEILEPEETFWTRVTKSMRYTRPTSPPSLEVGIDVPSEAEDFPHLRQIAVPDSAMGRLATQYAWNGNVDMEMQVYQRHLYHLLADQRATLSRRIGNAVDSGRSVPKMPYYSPSLFVPTSDYLGHIAKTLDLWIVNLPEDWTFIAEMQRQLGRFDASYATFQNRARSRNAQVEARGLMVHALAQKGIRAPALLSHGGF